MTQAGNNYERASLEQWMSMPNSGTEAMFRDPITNLLCDRGTNVSNRSLRSEIEEHRSHLARGGGLAGASGNSIRRIGSVENFATHAERGSYTVQGGHLL